MELYNRLKIYLARSLRSLKTEEKNYEKESNKLQRMCIKD